MKNQMSLIPYLQYVNRPNGARPPWYDPNLPGLAGARNLNHLRTMVPETFKRLYKRYNHNTTSWESKTGIAIANRVAKSPVPANIPEGDLFLPASAWYLSSAEVLPLRSEFGLSGPGEARLSGARL
jgi:hypothetical protein